MSPSILFFFLKIVLAILGSLNSYITFRFSLSASSKKPAGILKDIVESVDHLKLYYLNNITFSNPCIWYIFPFISVLNFFH